MAKASAHAAAPWDVDAEQEMSRTWEFGGTVTALTAREQQVLGLLVSGMDRNHIASQLHRSPNTVRTYIRNMTAKLGCHSAIEVVAVALRAGVRPQ